MTIEYKITFEGNSVTVTQSVDGDAALQDGDVGGGAPKSGDVSGGPGGVNRPIAVILGPLVIGGSSAEGPPIPTKVPEFGLAALGRKKASGTAVKRAVKKMAVPKKVV